MAFGLGIDFALYVFINERFPYTVTINKVCGIESQKILLSLAGKGHYYMINQLWSFAVITDLCMLHF